MAVNLTHKKMYKLDTNLIKFTPPKTLEISRSKSRTFLTGCLSIILAIIIIGMVIAFITGNTDLEGILYLPLPGLILYLMVRNLLRSRGMPGFLFDGTAQQLQLTGQDPRTIPFQDLSHLTNLGTAPLVLQLKLHLKNGEELELCTLSGAEEKLGKMIVELGEYFQAVAGLEFQDSYQFHPQENLID